MAEAAAQVKARIVDALSIGGPLLLGAAVATLILVAVLGLRP